MQKTKKEFKLKIEDFNNLKHQICNLQNKMKQDKIDIFNQALFAVCEDYNITVKELLSSSRKREIVLPRQIVMYKLSKLGFTLLEIAKLFGGKDHTTVMHAIKKIDSQKDIYSDIKL